MKLKTNTSIKHAQTSTCQNLQFNGGIAALVIAFAYMIGITLFVTILKSDNPLNPVEEIAFLMEKEAIMYITMIFIYVIAGFALVVLVQALYEQLKTSSPSMMQTTAVFGFLWAGIVIVAGMIFIIGMDTVINLYDKDPSQAVTVWAAVGIVFNGLGGGTEIVGGLWTLFISWVALRSGVFPKALNYLGLMVGVAGIVTIVPALEDLTMVFGLGQIPWFICLGILFLRNK
jgi:archaellum biogenesis protein FlaJ (TadC family)